MLSNLERPKHKPKSNTNIPQSSFPQPLSKEEEARYIEMYENGTKNEKKLAKDILIEKNLRLVAFIAKKYYQNQSQGDAEDLISIGTIGLIKGISSFNSEKGVRLATYVSRCIENEILMHLRATKKHNNDVYLQDPIGKNNEGQDITLEDKLASDADEIGEIVGLRMLVMSLYDKMEKVLNEREIFILKLRYGLDNQDELTQKEIAKMLGISRSYVSRIEKKILQKLRYSMEEIEREMK